jgi:hypothetical protein
MLKDLVKLANILDSKGFRKEADALDRIITASWGNRLIEERNYMMDPRTTAEDAYKGYDPRAKTITIKYTKYLDDDDMFQDAGGDWVEEKEKTLTLPARMEVCDLCQGTGTVVNPSIDASGLTSDDFYKDPDFEEEYFSGYYDIPCPQCRGNRVIPVVERETLSSEQRKDYDEYLEYKREMDAEMESDRRTMMAEMGFGW